MIESECCSCELPSGKEEFQRNRGRYALAPDNLDIQIMVDNLPYSTYNLSTMLSMIETWFFKDRLNKEDTSATRRKCENP